MKKMLFLVLVLNLSGCITKIKDLKPKDLEGHNNIFIVDERVTFDGNEGATCGITPYDFDDEFDYKLLAMDENYRILNAKYSSNILFDGVGCFQPSFLYNKARRKHLPKALSVQTEAGKLIYPGTVVIDWDSEGFGVLDVINGGGGLAEDNGALAMKIEDRSEEVKEYIRSKNPELLEILEFKTKKFKLNKKPSL
jgi:hypothetical protein